MTAATASSSERTVMIIANPTAGGYLPKLLARVKAGLENAGLKVVLRLTTHAGEIGEVCSNKQLAVSVLVIAGGDGSVNEALTGFQNNPAPPDLAIIPFGTANVLALELGLPKRADAIVRAITAHHTQPLHTGLANGRPFVLMASSGFDAEVVHGIPLTLKRKLGKLAYVLTALKIGLTRKSSDLIVEIDGEKITGKLAVATNGRCYGGPFVICPDASVTKAGLHLLILERDDPLSTFRFAAALLMGRVHKAKGVTLKAFQRARIMSTIPVAAQIDGDPFGTSPLQIEASSDSFAIVVPE